MEVNKVENDTKVHNPFNGPFSVWTVLFQESRVIFTCQMIQQFVQILLILYQFRNFQQLFIIACIERSVLSCFMVLKDV